LPSLRNTTVIGWSGQHGFTAEPPAFAGERDVRLPDDGQVTGRSALAASVWACSELKCRPGLGSPTGLTSFDLPASIGIEVICWLA
jgi:hypothetical protein